MGDIDDVLERVVTDVEFRRRLRDDPASALAGYDLSQADLELLASQSDDVAGQPGGVEKRTSKSSLFGLLDIATASADTGGPSSFLPDVDDEVLVSFEPGASDDQATDLRAVGNDSGLYPTEELFGAYNVPDADDPEVDLTGPEPGRAPGQADDRPAS